MTPLTRSASLTHFSEIARACGLDPQALVHEAGLPPRCLLDADLKVASDTVIHLLELAAQRAREPAFGLRMGESRRLSNLGPLALTVRDQPTLRHALAAIIRHIPRHNQAVQVSLAPQGAREVIRLELHSAARATRQATELALAVTFRTVALFMGSDWQPHRVCMRHSAPPDRQVHRRVFGPRIEFGQDFNGIVCQSVDLDRPNPSADPVMARYARELLEAQALGQGRFADQVGQLILLLMPLGQCQAKAVARHLGCDRRTITRRLAEEGLGFHALVNQHRVQLVQQQLIEGARSLAEISALLGFAEPSAFSRWYRQQFGQSARAQLAQLQSARGL